LRLVTVAYFPPNLNKILIASEKVTFTMSAYALPGLFPPIYTESSQSGDCSSGMSSSAASSPTSPLHEQKDSSRISDILIAVKEAKIDPVRLVQWITGSSRTQQQPQRKTLRRRGSRERLDTPQQSPASSKRLLQHEEKNSGAGTPHDEAIEFELSISFDGRKYTATRTMQCIVQLRDDLIREMKSRKRWLQIQRAAEPSSFENSVNSSNVEEDIIIQIPEIPPMTGDDSGSGVGFVGRGFTMLHAMVTSYVPIMELWLRNVMAIVPQDSECLSNFLWEPLASETPLDFPSKSCTSLATLDSIKELEYNTEDDDSDDDEW
jgi:hypothetical protein